MAEQEQNRTEQATPFKLAEARKQGQVSKSLDFNSFVAMFGLLLLFFTVGDSVAGRVAALCTWLLQDSASLRIESVDQLGWFSTILHVFIAIIVPIAVVSMVFAVLANLVQMGPVFSFEPLKPKFTRLNPVAGFKRIFNKKMLFEAVKTLLKLVFLGAILYAFFKALVPTLPAASNGDATTQLAYLSSNAKALLFRLGLAMLFIGLLDLVFVRWQFGKQMMMSRREVKEEVKRREGDPQIRAKIRALQRENLKQARSLGRVPEADVLITNPDHLAIALRYERGVMSAPHVISTGADSWAMEMKAIARRHDIPIVERRPLARQLFRSGQLDRPIPPETYVDVARVYADVPMDRHAGARHEATR
jgi:flagellar biosynthetic protein FlhB